MKKVLSVLLIVTLIFATVALTACQSADYTIGVMQFANHDALNKATEGFKQRMNQWAEENGDHTLGRKQRKRRSVKCFHYSIHACCQKR